MDLPRHAIDYVAPHCDLLERFEDVPPSARVRGVYFGPIETVLQRQGRLDAYRELFPRKVRWGIKFHPLKVYLLRLACAGAVLTSPEQVYEGMYEISRANAEHFASTLFGRALIRLLSRDPVKLTEQGIAARRQCCNYGQWTLVRHGPTEIEVVFRDEYNWIDSALLGAATGTYEVCGYSPTIETQLRNKYNGSTRIYW